MSIGTHKTASSGRTTRPGEVVVWDLFVRAFHWSLVILFFAAWYSGGIWDDPHLAAGYGVAALVAARIVWGFTGSKHARFNDFVYSPGAVFGYLAAAVRMRAPRYLGHNPAGGSMVIALLVTLVVLSVSGVMMTTEAFWGVKWVDQLHSAASDIALFLVIVHVGGVILSSIEHGENLVKAMITGRKREL